MVGTKIDISSTVIEKSLDVARNFLGKLLAPAIEEAGLLIKDQISYWRFRNQIDILSRAEKYCVSKQIDTKIISMKVLCPLLEYASIEDDNLLKDKWATLLGNMVDTEQNIQNHVLPYILSQVSIGEYSILLEAFKAKQLRASEIEAKLQAYLTDSDEYVRSIQERISHLNLRIRDIAKPGDHSGMDALLEQFTLEKERDELGRISWEYQSKEVKLESELSAPAIIDEEMISRIELHNLIRLGLIKEEKTYYAAPQSIDLPDTNMHPDPTIEVNVDLHSSTELMMTDLACEFIAACEDKNGVA